mmetsp:Transcript_50882/g.110099  ORF Transcript_50882/g.110099 Transcript_50882/m.110099 type:complete len:283 (-) Transcript_50882:1137-1985(-)
MNLAADAAVKLPASWTAPTNPEVFLQINQELSLSALETMVIFHTQPQGFLGLLPEVGCNFHKLANAALRETIVRQVNLPQSLALVQDPFQVVDPIVTKVVFEQLQNPQFRTFTAEGSDPSKGIIGNTVVGDVNLLVGQAILPGLNFVEHVVHHPTTTIAQLSETVFFRAWQLHAAVPPFRLLLLLGLCCFVRLQHHLFGSRHNGSSFFVLGSLSLLCLACLPCWTTLLLGSCCYFTFCCWCCWCCCCCISSRTRCCSWICSCFARCWILCNLATSSCALGRV